jgi:hypothetical protein
VSIFVLHPKITYWYALEEEEEKIDSTKEYNNCKVNINNLHLILFACKAKEVDSNRKFSDSSAKNVEKLADKDILFILVMDLKLNI